MRALLSLFTALLITITVGASSAHAQERVSSYNFAPSRHMIVDSKTSGMGKLMEGMSATLAPLRGERGKTLLVGCIGLALVSLIAGMPFAAIVAGSICIILILLNQPILLAGVLVGGLLLRKQIFAFLFLSEEERRERAKEKVDNDSRSAGDDKRSEKAKDTPAPPPKAATSGIPKLARPL